MGFDAIKKEIETEKSLEALAKRCTNSFTKKVKRALFEEVDNVVWSGNHREITRWCNQNKVYDEITEEEIEEIWRKGDPSDDEEPIRLNGKFVWESAMRVCDYINAREELIRISSLEEYRVTMKKVMRVIKEAHDVERKRRQTCRKKRGDEARSRTQRAKSLILDIKRGGMRKEDVEKRLEEIFGH